MCKYKKICICCSAEIDLAGHCAGMLGKRHGPLRGEQQVLQIYWQSVLKAAAATRGNGDDVVNECRLQLQAMNGICS